MKPARTYAARVQVAIDMLTELHAEMHAEVEAHTPALRAGTLSPDACVAWGGTNVAKSRIAEAIKKLDTSLLSLE